MRIFYFVVLSTVVTTTSAAEMSKEDYIDTAAKIIACMQSNHLDENTTVKAVTPRAQYYAKTHYTQQEMDEMAVFIDARSKKTITWGGVGCESALERILALPLPPQK